MSRSNEEILIDYLDNRLEGEERLEAERLIREDAAASQELESFRFSIELIREAAVAEQVMEVRKSFHSAAKVVSLHKKENGAIVRSFSKNALRVAAMILLLVGTAGVYKYSITNTSSVYKQNFTSFDLETSRGSNNDGELEKAYRDKNWTSVESIFSAQKDKTIKSWFLAGMAHMELKNYTAAIISFNEVMSLNKGNAEAYYQDEAEYYLAMSYMAAKQPKEAVSILKKIRNDKDHLFYKKASSIPALDLKMLELKD
ncbi:MAG: tetratricopeptide repeat protein [Bacteroidota bacterium]